MEAARFSKFGAWLLGWVGVCCAQLHADGHCTDRLQRDGVCRPFMDCPIVQEESTRNVTPSLCETLGGQSIVCCPHQLVQIQTHFSDSPSSTSPLPSEIGTPHKFSFGPATIQESTVASVPPQPDLIWKPGERANYWCKEYGKTCLGTRSLSAPTIAGGTPSLPNEFPHMAAIGFGTQSDIKWFCGGSLISEKFVLTAAHCLNSRDHGPAEWVLLGSVMLAANESFLGNTGQIHRIDRRISHPGYNRSEKYNDIALLEIGPALSRNQIPLNSRELHPACLRTEESKKYPSLTAAGWGSVGHLQDPSNHLLKVELNVFDEATCNETFETEIAITTALRRGIDSSMICAGVLSGGKDTCKGDSGGPLQVATDSTCQYEVLGITSFGKFCAFPNSPSLFTKVSAFIEWIEDEVWPL